MRASTFKPVAYMPLHVQQPPAIQRALFATTIEPRTEPPCDHPEAGWQNDLFLGLHYACTFCGVELPEPSRS